jgi:hypothetical protein
LCCRPTHSQATLEAGWCFFYCFCVNIILIHSHSNDIAIYLPYDKPVGIKGQNLHSLLSFALLSTLLQKDSTTGKQWFDMAAPEMTPQLAADLAVLKMRHVAFPRRFYKAPDQAPKYFQVSRNAVKPHFFLFFYLFIFTSRQHPYIGSRCHHNEKKFPIL